MNGDNVSNSSLTLKIDKRLKEKPLKYASWAKKGIRGDENSGNEKYLLELINESEYFQRKSGQEKYTSPETEACGECDAISKKYKIDFKLLISGSMAKAKANTEMQIEKIDQGLYIYSSSKDPSGKEYTGCILLKALRNYTYMDIVDEKYISDDEMIQKDIEQMLGWIKKQKNILMFLPSIFYLDEDITQEEKQLILAEAMQHDAYKLFELRKYYRPEFETYLCTILEDRFVIFGDSNNKLSIFDVVEVKKSKIFQYLEGVSQW